MSGWTAVRKQRVLAVPENKAVPNCSAPKTPASGSAKPVGLGSMDTAKSLAVMGLFGAALGNHSHTQLTSAVQRESSCWNLKQAEESECSVGE